MKLKMIFVIIFSLSFSSILAPANAAAKPKCSGKNLLSYTKNLKLFSIALEDYLKYSDPGSWESQNYSPSGLSKLRLDSYSVTLSYGRYLEKYAKICKVKMPQWWIDEWADFPDS